MKITDELLDKIANLSKLHLEGETREQLKADFQRILDFVEKLQELNTDEVEPLIHMTAELNHFRQDEPQAPLPRESSLSNAPKHDEAFFRVPKVLKK